MNVLQHLTTPALRDLAAALRSGRLAPPFAEVAVRRCCSAEAVAEAAGFLAECHHDGMKPTHVARMLEAVILAREQAPSPEDLVELVWTGPECEGLNNRDTGVVLRELFGTATTEVLIAGFAVYQGRDVFRRLAERMAENPTLRVRFFLDIRRQRNDAAPASEVVYKFVNHFRTSQWPESVLKWPELFFDPRSLGEAQDKRSSLHAKCVVIDRKIAFVTSANFTEAAQVRNIEVGVLVRSDRFAEAICSHFDTLQAKSMLVPAEIV